MYNGLASSKRHSAKKPLHAFTVNYKTNITVLEARHRQSPALTSMALASMALASMAPSEPARASSLTTLLSFPCSPPPDDPIQVAPLRHLPCSPPPHTRLLKAESGQDSPPTTQNNPQTPTQSTIDIALGTHATDCYAPSNQPFVIPNQHIISNDCTSSIQKKKGSKRIFQ